MDQLPMHMLKKVADLHSVPEGAYNIRDNGTLAGRNTTPLSILSARRISRGLIL